MRKVTMVVAVFTTNCHVSEKPKIGPLKKLRAARNAQGVPTK